MNYLQLASLIMRYERLLKEEKRPYIQSNIRRTICQLSERLEREIQKNA